jgi:hypothetical protein
MGRGRQESPAAESESGSCFSKPSPSKGPSLFAGLFHLKWSPWKFSKQGRRGKRRIDSVFEAGFATCVDIGGELETIDILDLVRVKASRPQEGVRRWIADSAGEE